MASSRFQNRLKGRAAHPSLSALVPPLSALIPPLSAQVPSLSALVPPRSIFAACLISLLFVAGPFPSAAEESAEMRYGPANLLKTMPTPFTSAPQNLNQPSPGNDAEDGELTLKSASSRRGSSLSSRLGLSQQLLPPRLYLPGRMMLGKSAEFIVKAKPGKWVALAMADKNNGARDICGKSIRLGADRKLVALAKVPESGLISLYVETPIQGDLIGQNLYFEAAVWSRPDFNDLEIAKTISSEQPQPTENAVLVAAETNIKRGVRFVPDSSGPPSQRVHNTLDSGLP